jgi:GNAT superfamily N-acetyltransferase
MSSTESPSKITLRIEEHPDQNDLETVRQGLQTFNESKVEAVNHLSLEILLRDEGGKVRGGLLGDTYWGWLSVSILWVDESLRGQGYGRRLLRAAEQEAIRRGCHSAHLDTMSFQARPFYEKEGYHVFGILEDVPIGNQRIFLYKQLTEKSLHTSTR